MSKSKSTRRPTHLPGLPYKALVMTFEMHIEWPENSRPRAVNSLNTSLFSKCFTIARNFTNGLTNYDYSNFSYLSSLPTSSTFLFLFRQHNGIKWIHVRGLSNSALNLALQLKIFYSLLCSQEKLYLFNN